MVAESVPIVQGDNGRDPRLATVDHIIPRSRGGTDDPSNLVICCHDCNSSKRRYTALEYLFFGRYWITDEWRKSWDELRRRITAQATGRVTRRVTG